MTILYFAPAATPQNPSMCPFVTQRVFELQRQGHSVTVLQYGNLIIKNRFETKRTGLLKPLAIAYKVAKSFFPKKNKLKKFENESGSFYYYDSLSFCSYSAFYKWYAKNGFDLIHAHFLWFSKPLPLLKHDFGIPYAVTVHGSDMHELTPYDKENVEEMLEILNNADRCIFISKYLLEHAKWLGYNTLNASVIYNGFNGRYFYFQKRESKTADEHVLGFVGHPIFIKRADVLPEVLNLVRKKLPNARLMILGSDEGDLLPYIKLKVCQLNLQNAVDFIPAVPPEQVADCMRKMDVLLFPSRNDGFGCVAIEAQACGLGVVASANGGIPEAVRKNGICVQESENFVTDFADSVVSWLKKEHDAQKIAESVKDYTWENCVKKECEVYKAIVMYRRGG